jgi:rhomboid family GlyGly-CTERM serine protease
VTGAPAEGGRSASWLVASAALAAGSIAAQAIDPSYLDWRRAVAASEPWRLWSAALVHWTPYHLVANLAGVGVVALWGWRARAGWRGTLAWAACWPLVQASLWLAPGLNRYGGLSGVLHAGVAVAAVMLACRGSGRSRWVAWAVLAGLIAKVLSEAPWGPPLRPTADPALMLAPWAHAAGTVLGMAAGALAARWPSSRERLDE